jgi:DNA topoisomerase-1
VTDGETNATLRKDDSVETISLLRAAELLADKRARGPVKKTAKKSATKKTAAKKTTAKKTTTKKTAVKKTAAKKTTAKKTAAKKS